MGAIPAFAPQIVSPPLAPIAAHALGEGESAAVANTVDQIARDLRVEDEAAGLGQGLETALVASPGGKIGRVVVIVGVVRNVGTTLHRHYHGKNVSPWRECRACGFRVRTPNLAVISTEPNAPGIADTIRGTASFGEIIARDQFSPVHLIAAGTIGNDATSLLSSSMLATAIEALRIATNTSLSMPAR